MNYLYKLKPDQFRVTAGKHTVIITFNRIIIFESNIKEAKDVKDMAALGNKILGTILEGNPDYEVKKAIIEVQKAEIELAVNLLKEYNINMDDLSSDIHSWGYTIGYCGIPFITVDFKKENERFDAQNFFFNLDKITEKCKIHIQSIANYTADYYTLKGLIFAIKLKKNMV